MIYAGDGGLESFAGAGNDWIEGSPQLDLLVGDENNQFQNDPNQGHDVIIGNKGDDDYDSEGGDDVMVGDVLGTERFEGMLGWDIATYRGDPLPVDSDMSINVVLAPNLNELRDRFDLTEGLSGWNSNDFLRGTDRIAADMVGHELTAAGIARIDGISALLPVGATSFTGGEIIMGGRGSDLLEGRGGDDIIDGDRWMNAQLRAPNPATPNPADFRFADGMKQLQTDVRAGRINPGTIDIVRSIVTPTAGDTAGNIDTAVFSGPATDYDVSLLEPSVFTVVHARGTLADGTDTLRNIEQLSFCDDAVIVPGTCALPFIVSTSDLPNLALSPSPLAFGTRAIGVAAATLPVTLTNTGGTDINVSSFSIGGLNATSFSATSNCVGLSPLTPGSSCTFSVSFAPAATTGPLTAQLVVNTDAGIPSAVGLTGTGVINTPASGAPVVSDVTPTEGTAVSALTAGIVDVNGVPGTFGFQWRQGTVGGGPPTANIAGATGSSFTPLQGQTNRRLAVVVTFVDLAGSAETRTSVATTVVGDLFPGVGDDNSGINTLTGTLGEDEYHGGASADSLSPGAGNDIASGDAGDDTISTGIGDDSIWFDGVGEGFDAVTGGLNVDTIRARSNGTDIGLRSFSQVEAITADGHSDVRIVGSPASNSLVFSTVALTGIVAIDGGGGNDILTGSVGADVIIGGAGLDSLNGSNGDDILEGGADADALNGAAGNDVFRYFAGFGDDTITGFDPNPTGGQDLIDLSGLGITAATFAGNVTIVNGGGSTVLITVSGQGTIRLNANAVSGITISDFVLAV